LPLLWWSDRAAGLAWAWSPLSSSPRLMVLLVAAAQLALMLWQWQQIVQALWLFSRPAAQVAQTLPLPASDAADRRLNLGLPLLLLPPLEANEPAKPTKPAADPEPAAASVSSAGVSGIEAGAAIAPEQGAEQTEGDDLNQQV
jgi:hypothetical protein